jgi:hypothetical protein
MRNHRINPAEAEYPVFFTDTSTLSIWACSQALDLQDPGQGFFALFFKPQDRHE